MHLSSPAQAEAGFDASQGAKSLGPAVTVHLVGVIRSPFWMDTPGDSGAVLASYSFVQKYRPYIVGDQPASGADFTNAVIRLKGGGQQIPAFGLAAAAGATAGVAAALIASKWMPSGLASLAEPDPGFNADWLVLGAGWAAAVLLVAAGTGARSG